LGTTAKHAWIFFANPSCEVIVSKTNDAAFLVANSLESETPAHSERGHPGAQTMIQSPLSQFIARSVFFEAPLTRYLVGSLRL
jgi:hypothetical protein